MSYKLASSLWNVNLACINGSVAIAAGGFADAAGKSCTAASFVFDTASPPPSGGELPVGPPLSATTSVVGGASGATAAVFFNGLNADVYDTLA